jgi:hypothetical protein
MMRLCFAKTPTGRFPHCGHRNPLLPDSYPEANIIVLRFFVGFGTGEGTRPNFKLAGGLL